MLVPSGLVPTASLIQGVILSLHWRGRTKQWGEFTQLHHKYPEYPPPSSDCSELLVKLMTGDGSNVSN